MKLTDDEVSRVIIAATGRALEIQDERHKQVAQFDADKVADVREEKRQCKTCFYLRRPHLPPARIHCPLCGSVHQGSTLAGYGFQAACSFCTEAYGLCRLCCGDITMDKGRFTRNQRKALTKRMNKKEEGDG